MNYRANPPYRPFYQLPYCCVPATLQWILYRHGLDILNQESIGAELGLRLPTKGKKLFKNRQIIFLDKTRKERFWYADRKKEIFDTAVLFKERHRIRNFQAHSATHKTGIKKDYL